MIETLLAVAKGTVASGNILLLSVESSKFPVGLLVHFQKVGLSSLIDEVYCEANPRPWLLALDLRDRFVEVTIPLGPHQAISMPLGGGAR